MQGGSSQATTTLDNASNTPAIKPKRVRKKKTTPPHTTPIPTPDPATAEPHGAHARAQKPTPRVPNDSTKLRPNPPQLGLFKQARAHRLEKQAQKLEVGVDMECEEEACTTPVQNGECGGPMGPLTPDIKVEPKSYGLRSAFRFIFRAFRIRTQEKMRRLFTLL